MADNTAQNGTATIRTDEVVAGIHTPVSKIALGIDGADDGFVGSTNPLPVKDVLSRTRSIFTFQSTAPSTSDTLLTIGRYLGGAAVASATTHAVTSGKRLVLTGGHFSVKAGAAAAAFATMILRANPSGAAVIGSPAVFRADCGLTAATSGSVAMAPLYFGNGIEFSGTDQIGISLSAQATTNIISLTLFGYEYTP